MLLSANVPDDAGYFGERLNAARSQLVQAWKARSSHLDPHFRQTDILGALQLASEIFVRSNRVLVKENSFSSLTCDRVRMS
jgi:hypothetical protein